MTDDAFLRGIAAVREASRSALGGLYLGRGDRGWAWASPERAILVLGPSRSGKTSSLIVPNVLASPGAVVSTSTKPDVVERTAAARTTGGWALLFDPSGTVDPPAGVHRVGWSPVNAARDWDGALAVADAMVRAARGRPSGPSGARGDDHWTERATALMAPLLHAAAACGAPMRTLLGWVDRHDGAQALEVLSGGAGEPHGAGARGDPAGRDVATDVLAGILATDSREQSGIWSTTSGVLAGYRSSAALASTAPPFLDAAAFCEGANTLYVCAAGARQQLIAPLVVGMLAEIRDAAYRRWREGTSGLPVLLALDEVTNIAPLPDLPAIVSEGAGQGLVTLACMQDLSQARARWGQEADGFLSLFGTTVVLPGIADVRTLEALSALAGDGPVHARSVASSRSKGRRQLSTSDSVELRRRLPVDVVARGAPGWAMAVDEHNRIGWVRLTPAHAVSPWRELTERGRTRANTECLGPRQKAFEAPASVAGEHVALRSRRRSHERGRDVR